MLGLRSAQPQLAIPQEEAQEVESLGHLRAVAVPTVWRELVGVHVTNTVAHRPNLWTWGLKRKIIISIAYFNLIGIPCYQSWPEEISQNEKRQTYITLSMYCVRLSAIRMTRAWFC